MIRRFFDVQPDGTVSAPAAPINIAELMAKGGNRTESAYFDKPQAPEPAAIPEPAQIVETTPAQTNTPVEPTVQATPATEPVAPAVTTIQTATLETAPAAPVVPTVNFDEELSKRPKDAILKALGYDEYKIALAEKMDDRMAAFFKHWQSKGDVKEYFEAVSTDYSKMSDEQIMRRDLQRKFPEMSDSQIDKLYKVRVEDVYKLNTELFEPDEVDTGKLLLQADSKAVREKFIQDQQNYLLAAPPETQQVDTLSQKQTEMDASLQEYNTMLNKDPFVKGFVESKQIKVGSGTDAFNVNLDNPQNVIGLLNNADVYAKALMKADGTPDFQKQIKMATFLANMDAYEQMLINHGKTLGQSSMANGLENASVPNQVTPSTANQQTFTSPAQAMAFKGRHSR